MLVSSHESLKHLQPFKAPILGTSWCCCSLSWALGTDTCVNLPCLAPEEHHLHEISSLSLLHHLSIFDNLREMKTLELPLKLGKNIAMGQSRCSLVTKFKLSLGSLFSVRIISWLIIYSVFAKWNVISNSPRSKYSYEIKLNILTLSKCYSSLFFPWKIW